MLCNRDSYFQKKNFAEISCIPNTTVRNKHYIYEKVYYYYFYYLLFIIVFFLKKRLVFLRSCVEIESNHECNLQNDSIFAIREGKREDMIIV